MHGVYYKVKYTFIDKSLLVANILMIFGKDLVEKHTEGLITTTTTNY